MSLSSISPDWQEAKPKTSMRPDIQLLRAFAVVAVVGYHFEVPGFGYGFLGVDIFLVISGYLVGGSLIREMASSGKINFSRFFGLRIRRSLPAALVVAVFTVGLLWVTNQLTTREIRHAFWSLVYLQNVNLTVEGNSYLGEDLNPSYFLHYWSLSLEEQFYVLAPLIILLIFQFKLGQKIIFLLTLIALASFAFALFQTFESETAAYFSIAARAWQFIIGMLVANYVPTKSLARAIWLIGAFLVFGFVSPITVFPQMGFPAPGAIVPTLLAGIYLAAGYTAPFRLPMGGLQRFGVLIGDMSYSIYLIHFPLALLFLEWSRNEEKWIFVILGLVATFFLSIVSKNFIEDPFRFGLSRSYFTKRLILAILLSNLLVAAALVATVYSLNAREDDKEVQVNGREGTRTQAINPVHRLPLVDHRAKRVSIHWCIPPREGSGTHVFQNVFRGRQSKVLWGKHLGKI